MNVLKTARRTMRKDKGLSGDIDRMPQLTWLMFLKFLDDQDRLAETEAAMSGRAHHPLISAPYRWRDWAALTDGLTGDALLTFLSSEAVPIRDDDGQQTTVPGLLPHLRTLQGADEVDRRDVVARIFGEVSVRMRSGYLLRDLINTVNEIQFTSSDEIHTLGTIYESMLKEMRDASGDAGEYYTPRPVVEFMVQAIDPQLGESVLDPASGTGGFLVEAFRHLGHQVQTTEDRNTLQGLAGKPPSLLGGEPKPLPYLLCQMNLLLHGVELPNIDPLNSLRHPLSSITDAERVDVVLTNPPFGGEEERGILSNFPPDRQTTETALLFLQLIMERLKRQPPGRAAVIAPDGVLAARDGVPERIKRELLTRYNLHTVVRLPAGVFEPYTPIPTNILFFDRSGPTTEVWFYEHPLPDGRKKYVKTAPIKFDEFGPCLAWWSNREESDRAWKVTAEELLASGCFLDLRHPSRPIEDLSVPVLAQAAGLRTEASRLSGNATEILQDEAWATNALKDGAPMAKVALAELLIKDLDLVTLDLDTTYRLIGVRLEGRGAFLREERQGREVSVSKLNRVKNGQLIYSRLFAWRGAFATVPPELDGAYASGEFPTYRLREELVVPEFLQLYFSRPLVWSEVESRCTGTTKQSRNRFKEAALLAMEIGLPNVPLQLQIVERARSAAALAASARAIAQGAQALPVALMAELYDGGL